ncbi:MAG: hypothetical protein ACE5G9_10630 [Nitrospinales bacterium]
MPIDFYVNIPVSLFSFNGKPTIPVQPTRTLIFSLILTVCLSACAPIFENDADVQARQALLDLMKIQETFHQEHGRYAKNLEEIGKYGLKYHSGIVYLEIQYAEADQYRAISLPAESTTARVFAYDTERGGFYEMDEEVPQYVLGALNYIRGIQKQKNTTDFFSALLIVLLLGMGIKSFARNKTETSRTTYTAYFLSLIPLGWALALLNHLDEATVFSPLILGAAGGSILIAGFCLLVCGKAVADFLKNRGPTALVGLFTAMTVTSLLSIAVMVHSLLKYYKV